MPTFRKIALLLLLVTLLAAPWASAASPRAGSLKPAVSAPAGKGLLVRVRIVLTGIWTKIGCHIDPNGVCLTTTAPPDGSQNQSDIGCNIDPNGQCHP